MERRNVSFKAADGLVLHGWIYPTESKSPCIIMSHGLGGIRHKRLPNFAERFHDKGYSVLLYDNRHWGESEGLPRQHTNPFAQLFDYFDAFNFVRTMPFVDESKIVYWGSSFSGGNVIYAAAMDKRIKAAIIQCSSVSGEVRAEAFKDQIVTLLDQRAQLANGEEQPRIGLVWNKPDPAASEYEHVLFPTRDAYDELIGTEQLGRWENAVTAQTQLYMALSEPQAVIHRISPTPLLMVIPENDTVVKTSAQIAAFDRAREPKEKVLVKGAGHFDIYSGKAFEQNIASQLSFLDRMLS